MDLSLIFDAFRAPRHGWEGTVPLFLNSKPTEASLLRQLTPDDEKID